jgi:hypothetical protein
MSKVWKLKQPVFAKVVMREITAADEIFMYKTKSKELHVADILKELNK